MFEFTSKFRTFTAASQPRSLDMSGDSRSLGMGVVSVGWWWVDTWSWRHQLHYRV